MENLNTNPSAILTADVGTTVLINGHELKVESHSRDKDAGSIFMTITKVNPSGVPITPKLADSPLEEGYKPRHFRDIETHRAVFARSMVVDMLTNGKYYIG